MKRIKWIVRSMFVLGFLVLLSVSGCKKESDPKLEPFNPAGVLAHYTFENSPADVSNHYDPTAADIVDITYEASRNGTAGKAASFNGTTSLIEIPNSDQFLTYGDFTIAFWIKPSSDRVGHFVLGLQGDKGFYFEIDTLQWSNPLKSVKLTAAYNGVDSVTKQDNQWKGDGKSQDTGGWQGITFSRNAPIAAFFKDQWVHVVCVYNSGPKIGTMYVNGEKAHQFDFDFWPEGDVRKKVIGVIYGGNPPPGNKLALGFIQARQNRAMLKPWANYLDHFSNHFKGLMDDVWIFSIPLSDVEVAQMYNSEKP